MEMFTHPKAEIYIPDGAPEEAGLSRTTHLAISAHQDDIEIMAVDGILKCYQNPEKWFAGAVVTNGSGSPRAGLYAETSDEDMQAIRVVEQKRAAYLGDYGAQVFLGYPSSDVKDPANRQVIEDLKTLMAAASPEIIYTHNLADKHATHIGVVAKVIQALRELPTEQRPAKLYGCEVWRDLDWMMDDEKVVFDLSAHENLQTALVGVFDSQVSGGKRYDLAAMGRRVANATFFASHDTDEAEKLSFAMDLTPLIEDADLDVQAYVQGFIQRFAEDVAKMIGKRLPKQD
ncbi:PIG-L family deacetylase [bacterium]|nr:PIG-L family deacetylase [bacterium]